MDSSIITTTHLPLSIPGNQELNQPFFSQQSKQSDSSFFTDTVSLSREGKKASSEAAGDSIASEGKTYKQPLAAESSSEQYTADELKEMMKLRTRDTEVRAHEQAHLASAGQYAAGGASFSYQTGPDGRRYATGGEVPIDMSKEATPEETIQKMRIVARAALAPANPSPADRNIAARAAQIQGQARREIQEGKANESSSSPVVNSEQQENSGNNEADNTVHEEPGNSFMPHPADSISQNSRQMILKVYSHHQS